MVHFAHACLPGVLALMRLSRAARVGLLLALALATYAGAIFSGFAMDDRRALLDNAVVNGSAPAAEAWTTDHWGHRDPVQSGMWRPLLTLWFRADRAIFGGSASGFHLVNVLLHACVVALGYLAFAEAFGDPPAFLAAALFAVFAAPSEAVEAIVGRADLLVALCAIGGFWAHLRGKVFIAAALLAIAAATKESAVLIPAAWLLCTQIRRRPMILYGIALALVLGARAVLFGFPHIPVDPLLNPQYFATPALRVLGAGHVFARFFAPGIVDPFRRLYVCSAPACSPVSDALSWLGLALALLLALSPLLLWKRAPAAAKGMLWFCIFYFPLSNFLVRAPAVYAERLTYAPALGLCLAIAAGIARLPSRPISVALSVALLAINFLAVQVQNLAWRNSSTLSQSALAIAPDSAQVQHNEASALLHDGDAAGAELHAREALRLFPGRGETLAILAVSLAQQGKTAEARRAFEEAGEKLHWSPQISRDYQDFLHSTR